MDCDVRNPSNILDAVNEAKKIYDQDVDIFYNNAGVENLYRPYSSIDMNSFKNAMAVNVESVIASINHAGDVMRKNKSGARRVHPVHGQRRGRARRRDAFVVQHLQGRGPGRGPHRRGREGECHLAA